MRVLPKQPPPIPVSGGGFPWHPRASSAGRNMRQYSPLSTSFLKQPASLEKSKQRGHAAPPAPPRRAVPLPPSPPTAPRPTQAPAAARTHPAPGPWDRSFCRNCEPRCPHRPGDEMLFILGEGDLK